MNGVLVSSPDLRPSLLGILEAFATIGELSRVVMTIGFRAEARLMRYAGKLLPPLEALTSRRMIPPFVSDRVSLIPLGEVVCQAAARVGLGEAVRHRLWQWAEPYFDRQVARRFAGRTPILYGHEHASLESFQTQKRSGGFCVLRQVMAHFAVVDRIGDEEIQRFPEAEREYDRIVRTTRSRVNDRKSREYGLADLILVNSDFVRRTFIESGVPARKVVAVPTGCPPVIEMAESRYRDRVVFLSAGHLSLRKGTLYLLEAWRRLRPAPSIAELWLAGKVMLPMVRLAQLREGVRTHGLLSRSELDDRYKRASVFVLPTLCEGLAHVILEALSYGLPVITTPNSGAEGLVEDGVNGWIVPIRDSDALADRMAWCIEHPVELEEMGERSLRRARGWTVERSVEEHVKVVLSLLDRGSAG